MPGGTSIAMISVTTTILLKKNERGHLTTFFVTLLLLS